MKPVPLPSIDKATIRHASVLVVGSVVSQILPLLAAPLLTRLYSPSDFGIFGMFFAASNVLSIVVTGRFELAVLLPKSDRAALEITLLALLVTGLGSVLLSVFCAGILFLGWLDQEVSHVVPYGVVMVLGLAVHQSLTYWFNRKEDYRRIAFNRILRSGSTVGTSIVAGWSLGLADGLIIGAVVGQSLAALALAYPWIRDAKPSLQSLSGVKQQAARYNAFPRFSLVGDTINSASSQLPYLVFGAFFPQAVGGFFTLAQRVCGAPSSVIASSVGDVFRQRAAVALMERGNFREVWKQTFTLLLCTSTIPFLVVYLFGPTLFGGVFGSEWEESGVFASILAPFYWLAFTGSVLGRSTSVAERQRADMLWQLGLFAVVATALYVGVATDSHYLGLRLYSGGYSAMYFIYLVMSYRFSGPSGRPLQAAEESVRV